MGTHRKPPPGGRLVFCRSYRHAKTGRRIYARSGTVFCFVLKD
jgi:hypothetical protein